MSSLTATSRASASANGISRGMTLLLAAACGLGAANLYYAQPLIGPIGDSLGLSPAARGLIVTLTQVGYGLGLLLIVPLADLFENRRLIVILLGLAALALTAAALSTSAPFLLAAALCIGLASVAVQIIVPFASHFAPAAIRGKVVGNVMSGLMFGIMLARPVASAVAGLASWHLIFFLSAAGMVALALVLWRALPERRPHSQLGYAGLLASMRRLALTTPVLQRRAFYQAAMFGAFSLFWTTVPLYLAGPAFRLSQGGIALFALAGVAGAVAAPIAGRIADRGWGRPATALAMLSVILAFAISHVAAEGTTLALGLLVAAAILLDFGVTANLTVGQRVLFALGPEYRSRLNGLYMATFFGGGAIASALGGWAYAQGGWLYASALGALMPAAALAYFATERR